MPVSTFRRLLMDSNFVECLDFKKLFKALSLYFADRFMAPLFFFSTLLVIGLYAQNKTEPPLDADCCLLYLADRPQNSCSNPDIFANALFWHATESVDWALVNFIDNPNMQTHSFKSVSFGWDPGFRVGIGYNMDYDGWDTQLTYTWFRTRAFDAIQPGPGIIKPAFWGFTTALTESFISGQLHWNINFNILDWDLGRAFWIGKDLSIRPLIGLKGGLIDQTIYSNWQNPTISFPLLGTTLTATENLKQNFRGLGPKGGIGSKWVFNDLDKYVFSLIADFAAGFLWGHWKFKDHFQDNFLVSVNTEMSNSNFGALVLQSLIGLGFDFNFRQDQSHFSFKMGYEIQDWFSAYQLFDDNTGQHNNDLVLQGLTLNFRLDY